MDKQKIARINLLAKKSKTEGLTDEEKAEQQALRDEYRAYMRRGFEAELANTYTIDENGNKKSLLKVHDSDKDGRNAK